jgi:hypothetical protein
MQAVEAIAGPDGFWHRLTLGWLREAICKPLGRLLGRMGSGVVSPLTGVTHYFFKKLLFFFPSLTSCF